jgi:hypothetical protein
MNANWTAKSRRAMTGYKQTKNVYTADDRVKNVPVIKMWDKEILAYTAQECKNRFPRGISKYFYYTITCT